MNSAQLSTYRSFCRVRRWNQNSKGLRYAYQRLTETGDPTWLLIASDCAERLS